jgi:hypothetical protein
MRYVFSQRMGSGRWRVGAPTGRAATHPPVAAWPSLALPACSRGISRAASIWNHVMRPRINFCIFNHSRSWILDQIWFVQEVFAQQGYVFVCSDLLEVDCINLLAENFTQEDVRLVQKFCRHHRKQVGIVMTEHVEIGSGGFSFNGSSLKSTGYIVNKEERLFNLLALTDDVFGFFTCGPLPELRTWSSIVPTHRVHRLPFPAIRSLPVQSTRKDYDIVFTGAPTPYRKHILSQIAATYKVLSSGISDTEEERSNLYERAKVAVNIPQSETWEWVSPMRVLFGLRVGVPTVHLGRRDSTAFTSSILEPIELRHAVGCHEELFRRQLEAYDDFVQSKHNAASPFGVLDIWADLELGCSASAS